MSSAEFTEWQAYHRIIPIGPYLDDYRAGLISAVMANVHRGKGRARQPADFMLDYLKERKKAETPAGLSLRMAEARNIFNKISEAQGHGR